MRFLLVSTHTDQTIGYSKIATNILQQISNRIETSKENVKIFHFGFQRHPSRSNVKKIPKGVVSYDAAANEDPKQDGFGFNKIHEYIEMVQPDVVMIYNDILTISKFIDAMLPEKKTTKPYKLWLYLDVIYRNMHPVLLKRIFEVSNKIYVFSETAKKHMMDYNDNVTLYGTMPTIAILEHAVDESVFRPVKSTKIVSREQMGIPTNAVVLLNCNRNSARKRLDLCVMAFVRLLKKRPSLPVYFIFATGTQGYYDIGRMYMEELKKMDLTDEHLKKRLILIDTSANLISDEGINELYNICDIGVNTSSGEGFGLCTFEHMFASGSAQIITDTGCYAEYLGATTDQSNDLAVLVKPNGYGYFDTAQSAFGFEYPTFHHKDIVLAFEQCIDNLSLWKDRATLIREKLKTWEQVTEGIWNDIVCHSEKK